jgi:uncharacterized membrane protein YhaH (DUF805 family)
VRLRARLYSRAGFVQELSMKSRLNRAGYIWRAIAVSLVFGVIAAAGADIHGSANFDPEFLVEGTMRGKEEAAIPLLALLTAQVITLVFIAKRFHDLNRSAWYILGMIVPLYNIYLAIILLFQKGTTGPNRFGPDPLAS